MKYLVLLVSICVWTIVGWRMQWNQLMLGQVPLLDFDIYYQTAKDVIASHNPLTLPYMQTSGPPSVILPFLPLSLLPLPVARSIVEIGSMLAIWLTGWLLARQLEPKYVLITTSLISTGILVAFPSRFNLGQGQPNLIIMLLAVLVITNHKPWIRALAATGMGLIKTNYLVSFASLKRSILWRAIVVLGGLIIVGFVVVKPSYYVDFLTQRANTTINGSGVLTDVDYYNQSLKSTLARFGMSAGYGVIFWGLTLLTLAYLWKTKDVEAGILLSLLLSPLLWQHYVVVAYPVGISLLLNKKIGRQEKIFSAIALGLLVIELPWLHHQPITPVNSILASHYFWGLGLLLALRVTTNRRYNLRSN